MKTRLFTTAYWHRHIRIAIKYGSIRKLVNLTRAYLAYTKSETVIKTMPSFLKIEISRKCSIKCKYCEMIAAKEETFYPFDRYKQIIDRFADYIFEVSLYDIGDPLENNELVEFIKYAHRKKIGTTISTSLSINKPDIFWEQLVLSGIDRIIVAIDGVSEDVYKKYRTNGDLALVLSNLDRLLYYKAKQKKNVFIEWQMLDLPWNKSEQNAAKEMSVKIRCNGFTLVNEAVLPRLENNKVNIIRKKNCILPYIILIINSLNKVRACYKIYHEDMILGDLNQTSFDSIWNGPEIARIRDKKKICTRQGCRTCRE